MHGSCCGHCAVGDLCTILMQNVCSLWTGKRFGWRWHPYNSAINHLITEEGLRQNIMAATLAGGGRPQMVHRGSSYYIYIVLLALL